MNRHFFTLKPIQELADKGFKPAALVEIERMAYTQAAMALPGASAKEIARAAEDSLPPGVNLHALYTQTLAAMMTAPLSQLEEIADHLQVKADLLETAYVKVLARDGASFAERARLEGSLAEDYASLLSTARDLESRNVISVARSSTLQAITEPSDGPLRNLHDKALAIMAARETEGQLAPRMRMSA
jgi:hypothetical protein